MCNRCVARRDMYSDVEVQSASVVCAAGC